MVTDPATDPMPQPLADAIEKIIARQPRSRGRMLWTYYTEAKRRVDAAVLRYGGDHTAAMLRLARGLRL